jgi:hypothetical protein
VAVELSGEQCLQLINCVCCDIAKAVVAHLSHAFSFTWTMKSAWHQECYAAEDQLAKLCSS